jgi:hypothetical protein
MTAGFAMLPPGVVAARTPPRASTAVQGWGVLDETPTYEPLAAWDAVLVRYRVRSAPAVPGAYAATPYTPPAITGGFMAWDALTPAYAAEPYSPRALDGAVAAWDTLTPRYGAL